MRLRQKTILALLMWPFLACASSTVDHAIATLPAPFGLSIVPTWSRSGEHIIDGRGWEPFFVVMTNTSSATQNVWESWNSWGYQNIRFELTLANGQTYVVAKKPQIFTRNFPSTFAIPPGGQQIYPIHLDMSWSALPSFVGGPTDAPVAITAIYEVSPSEEATQQSVWVGTARSETVRILVRW
jgi:hypothetical protein